MVSEACWQGRRLSLLPIDPVLCTLIRPNQATTNAMLLSKQVSSLMQTVGSVYQQRLWRAELQTSFPTWQDEIVALRCADLSQGHKSRTIKAQENLGPEDLLFDSEAA